MSAERLEKESKAACAHLDSFNTSFGGTSRDINMNVQSMDRTLKALDIDKMEQWLRDFEKRKSKMDASLKIFSETEQEWTIMAADCKKASQSVVDCTKTFQTSAENLQKMKGISDSLKSFDTELELIMSGVRKCNPLLIQQLQEAAKNFDPEATHAKIREFMQKREEDITKLIHKVNEDAKQKLQQAVTDVAENAVHLGSAM